MLNTRRIGNHWFKVDESWEVILYLLGKWELRHNIAEMLKVPPYVLYLSLSARDASAWISWYLPVHLFPLSASQEKALLTANSLRLECEEYYVWQVCCYSPASQPSLVVFSWPQIYIGFCNLGFQLLTNASQCLWSFSQGICQGICQSLRVKVINSDHPKHVWLSLLWYNCSSVLYYLGSLLTICRTHDLWSCYIICIELVSF